MTALKYLRLLFALLLLTALSAFFLDFTELMPRQLHALASIQFVPAVVSLMPEGQGLLIVAVWFAVTLLFGRIYCSAVCPFGILQDVLTRLAKWIRGKKFKFQYQQEIKSVRYLFLALLLLGLAAPLSVLVSFLDPYSHFGRTITWIFRPLLIAGNNALVPYSGGTFSYAANYISGISLFAAAAVFLFTAILAVMTGRRYCNTICPVGTLLGLLSRYSLFRIRITTGCKSCGLCEKQCKGECLDSKNKTVDASRCVACFNCLRVCKFHALTVIPQKPKAERLETSASPQNPPQSACGSSAEFSRRTVLSWSVFSFFVPSFLRAGDSATDSSLPKGISRRGYTMNVPVLLPGAVNQNRFRKNCTACHLCVTKCPAHCISPATTELGLSGFLQPIMNFRHGYCQYDCTICADICPAHALTGLHTPEEKHLVQMGKAVFLEENCVLKTQGTNCGACAEHCPTGAIQMVPFDGAASNLLIPEVKSERCIGCGACEYICPVNPYRAIYVQGLAEQGKVKPAHDPNEKQQEVKLDGFGF
ncbi:MAG: 4Fe-4S binding protein [Planctomycetaceae bacterium]|jgi:ferredoxin|nr:4Fe-4S binding protein [Planctomycetaceae bacterium]